jgi:hypothetical protein
MGIESQRVRVYLEKQKEKIKFLTIGFSGITILMSLWVSRPLFVEKKSISG